MQGWLGMDTACTAHPSLVLHDACSTCTGTCSTSAWNTTYSTRRTGPGCASCGINARLALHAGYSKRGLFVGMNWISPGSGMQGWSGMGATCSRHYGLALDIACSTCARSGPTCSMQQTSSTSCMQPTELVHAACEARLRLI